MDNLNKNDAKKTQSKDKEMCSDLVIIEKFVGSAQCLYWWLFSTISFWLYLPRFLEMETAKSIKCLTFILFFRRKSTSRHFLLPFTDWWQSATDSFLEDQRNFEGKTNS